MSARERALCGAQVRYPDRTHSCKLPAGHHAVHQDRGVTWTVSSSYAQQSLDCPECKVVGMAACWKHGEDFRD